MTRYQQLAEQLKLQIETRVWRSGDKVPSVRMTSRNSSLSTSTVIQAYKLLEAQGWLVAKPQSGYFVTSIMGRVTEESSVKATKPHFSDKLYEFLQSSSHANVALGSAFPDPSLFPLQSINRHLASAGRKMSINSVVENMPPGNEALRRQIAQRYINHGLSVSHNDIVITSGAMEALNLSLQVVTHPGDTIVIEAPAFYGAIQAVERLGLKAIEVPVNLETGLCVNQFEKVVSQNDIKVCWIMPSFQNPTGTCLSYRKRQKIIELANQFDVVVVEDDVYSELYFGEQRPRPIKYWDKEDRVLLCGSFSKSLCPGYRVGWVVNQTFHERLQKAQLVSTLAGSLPVQEGIAHFLKYESFDKHLRKIRKELSNRQKILIQTINSYFPSNITVNRPSGGYFIWVELGAYIDTYRVYKKLQKNGISIAYGGLFSVKDQFQDCIRLNTSYPVTQELKETVRYIALMLS
ncbi:PLP-dependent aminotransferase family protein [Vibrio hepatarius]|uniref:aminotransferase-like domain-containing protein n=1 Tax=Vibrio hepatarius TaxID=171383 RepID=UPI001C0969CC|nr:PLP-dependent aminotransferase family protein [Vibrio hepatarius]MBU2898235.1 PLP-dependent aminotransferase family protein [Vibrio hepatarius]